MTWVEHKKPLSSLEFEEYCQYPTQQAKNRKPELKSTWKLLFDIVTKMPFPLKNEPKMNNSQYDYKSKVIIKRDLLVAF